MTTLSANTGVTLTVGATDMLLIDCPSGGRARVEAISGVAGASTKKILVEHPGGRRQYGPFGAGTISLGAIGQALRYDYGASPSIPDPKPVLYDAETQSLVSGDENFPLLVAHPNYLFHGCARLQTNIDPTFGNLMGGSDASFAASLPRADAWASVASGFVATLNVANGNIAVPAPNFDYNAGEKLLVVWVGQMTPEGADTGIMGTSGASSLKGIRIRAKTTGEMNFVLYDSVGPVSLFSNTTSSDAAGRCFVASEAHSFAVLIDGAARSHTMWVDEAINRAAASLGAGAACDTLTSSPFNLGCTTTGGTDCAVVNTSVFALFKWTAAQAAPAAADITEVLKQIRKNPTRLVLTGVM